MEEKDISASHDPIEASFSPRYTTYNKLPDIYNFEEMLQLNSEVVDSSIASSYPWVEKMNYEIEQIN